MNIQIQFVDVARDVLSVAYNVEWLNFVLTGILENNTRWKLYVDYRGRILASEVEDSNAGCKQSSCSKNEIDFKRTQALSLLA